MAQKEQWPAYQATQLVSNSIPGLLSPCYQLSMPTAAWLCDVRGGKLTKSCRSKFRMYVVTIQLSGQTVFPKCPTPIGRACFLLFTTKCGQWMQSDVEEQEYLRENLALFSDIRWEHFLLSWGKETQQAGTSIKFWSISFQKPFPCFWAKRIKRTRDALFRSD